MGNSLKKKECAKGEVLLLATTVLDKVFIWVLVHPMLNSINHEGFFSSAWSSFAAYD